MPWPALHHSRLALRHYAAGMNALRDAEGPAALGPRRMPWGLQHAVKEDGSCELRIWPTTLYGGGRAWDDRLDRVWRDELRRLRRLVGNDLMCLTELKWMPGGGPIELAEKPRSLIGIEGFWGWKRGAREPTQRQAREAYQNMARAIEQQQSA